MRLGYWIAMLVTLIVMLVAIKDVGPVLLLLYVFIMNMMLLCVTWSAPKFVRKRRREQSTQPRLEAKPHPQVPERSFASKYNRWSQGVLLLIGGSLLIFSCLFLVFWGLVSFPIRPMENENALIVLPLCGLALVILGGVIFQMGLRLHRISTSVTPDGISSVRTFGTRHLAWDEIIAVTRKEYRYNNMPLQTSYVVYGLRASIEFNDKTVGFEELRQIVEENVSPEALG